MRQPKNQTFYDLLDDRQKDTLQALNDLTCSNGEGTSNTEVGSRAIEIRESWLLDDEQKQSLKANVWDIFFLYAGARIFWSRKSGSCHTHCG